MSVFGTTHWSVVLRAGAGDSQGRAAAFEQIYRTYWYPIYWFIRRHRGYDHHEAEDLTQAFFAHLLEEETLEKAAREHGKFRTFLLAVLVKLLANEWDRRRTWKRGGRCQTISIDEALAEGLYGCEPVETETPDRAFDRRWAAALLRRVFERLHNECIEGGKAALFDQLGSALLEASAKGRYADAAVRLGMSEGAVRVALHRLRSRFRELLRRRSRTRSRPRMRLITNCAT